ncbi:MAG: LysR substrate-binding domain-containing protein, partial [Rhodoferax sp.]|nr:LysR substrate-binding domain-containing protein [Rhodoferax sp.]
AGAELLREANRLLIEIDAVANRVKRVATGWEAQFTIAVDTIISRPTVMELCDAFYALSPPTHIRLRHEALSGTLEALTSGQADLAIGTGPDSSNVSGLQTRLLGSTQFVFAVAPHHPLATAPEPLSDALIQRYRAVAVADSVQRGSGLTFGIFSGQDVFTVASMRDKLQAHLRGMGVGNLPLGMAQRYLESGHLVIKQTERPHRLFTVHYAWKKTEAHNQGRAMQWWLGQLESAATRAALLENHAHF